MRRIVYLLTVMAVLWTLPLPYATGAEEGRSVEVARAAICLDVVDREPVGGGTSFASSIGKLFCFTHVKGAAAPTAIHHVWHFAETERAAVTLSVKATDWRTYSSKIIQSHEIGSWRVDILDAEGNLLQSLPFEITP